MRWQASSKILHSKTLVLDVIVLVLCIMVFSVLIQDVDEVDVYVDDVVDVAVPCHGSFSSGFLAMKKITTTWSISNIAIFNRGQLYDANPQSMQYFYWGNPSRIHHTFASSLIHSKMAPI